MQRESIRMPPLWSLLMNLVKSFPFFAPPDSKKSDEKSSGVNLLFSILNSTQEKTATSVFSTSCGIMAEDMGLELVGMVQTLKNQGGEHAVHVCTRSCTQPSYVHIVNLFQLFLRYQTASNAYYSSLRQSDCLQIRIWKIRHNRTLLFASR